MFSYFLNPTRLIACAIILLTVSMFAIPINRIDLHLTNLLFTTYCIVAYFKVKKNGTEFYSTKISENRKFLIALFSILLLIMLVELYNRSTLNKLDIVFEQIILAPFILVSGLFYFKVFLQK